MAAYTLEQHKAALAKAEEAGDTAAVATIKASIDAATKKTVAPERHLSAFQKAAEAGDIDATDTIAASYRASRKGWSRDAAKRDPMWIQNAKTLHSEVEGKPFAGSDEEAAEWLKSYMSDFNYRLVGIDKDGARGTINIANSVQGLSTKAKAAFLASMDDFDNLPWMSGEGFKEMMKRGLTDPTNLIGIGTFGAGTAVKQAGQQAAKKGLKEAIKYGAKQAARGATIGAVENAASSAVADSARQYSEIEAGRDQEFDWKRVGKSAGVGAVVGGGVGSLGGAVAIPRIGKAANKIKVADQEAAGRVAARQKALEDSGVINWKNVKDDAPDGAVAGINKIHKDINVEVESNMSAIRHLLDPTDEVATAAERSVRELAWKGFKNSRTKVEGSITPDELRAIDQLAGHTEEGRKLIALLEEKHELQRLARHGAKGGVSKFTDEFNPFAHGGSKLGQGARALKTFGSAANYATLGIPGLMYQATIGASGRLIDSITGRRKYANLFKKQNLGTDKPIDLRGTSSQFELNRQARVQEKQRKQVAKEEAKLEKIRNQADADNAKYDEKWDNIFRQADAENQSFDRKAAARQVKEAAKAANASKREAERQAKADNKAKTDAAKADAKKVAQDTAEAAKADRDKFKMLQNAARAAQAMKREAEKQKKAEIPKMGRNVPKMGMSLKEALEQSLADPKAKLETPRKDVDSEGKPIKSSFAYNAGVRRIVAMQNSAKAKASAAKDPEVKKIILDAVSTLESRDYRGPKNHKKRLEVLAEAKAKARTMEQREVVSKALTSLAEVFK